MDKIDYAVVICSKDYKEVIYSVLSKNDVMFTEVLQGEDKFFCEFVKQNTSDLSNYDAIIVELGSLKDEDGDIIEAIEMIRFYDDRIRIIILEGSRENSYGLLHKCFLNGIYNLIISDSYINIRNKLEKCVLNGMSYKEALSFRSDEPEKYEKKIVSIQKKTIVFSGTQNRVGVTHCVISAAYTLKNNGYIVAVVDCTGSMDYLNIMKSYEKKLKDEISFTLDDIDFYIKPAYTECITPDNPYNFILYDIGTYVKVSMLNESEIGIYMNANERIVVCGSKPWEIPYLSEVISTLNEIDKSNLKYLFNLTDASMIPDIRKMMKEAGVEEKRVFFMDFVSEAFKPSSTMKDMLGLQPVKKKKRFFRKKGE